MTIPEGRVSKILDCATNFPEAFHPRPKGALVFSKHSFADGFRCCHYTVGGAVQDAFVLWMVFSSGPLTQGY